ncbi:MAG TPA: polysaccharide biosynthesis protein, partial [Candidatus Latescibacteria bacterium]|nr:polysaccharide biosynthesis protein [Candidatus Latescibacterota bacterium]
MTRRLHHELGKVDREKRILVYGAGDAAERIILNMLQHELFEPVGIVDDDPHKVGKRIHGIRVLGTRQHLKRIIASANPNEVLI